MNEIPERAFVIAERMKSRQNSEAEIRAALTEFELSDKQINEVLKKTGNEEDVIRNVYVWRGLNIKASRTPLSSYRVRPSFMDMLRDLLAGMGKQLLYILIVLGLLFFCLATNLLQFR